MKGTPLEIKDLIVFEPTIFSDERGVFFESFNLREFRRLVGRDVNFVQDNHSCSLRHVLRGLHYQVRQPQAKLVRVLVGEVFDVVVDIRRSSPTFGKWVGTILSAENRRQLWIPEGFAHGFFVLSDYAETFYKVTNYWDPDYERCLLWNDPAIGINWPVKVAPVISSKDAGAALFHDAELFP